MGAIDLSFPNTERQSLDQILTQSHNPAGIEARQTGNSAALRISIPSLTSFGDPGNTAPIVHQSFSAVRKLLSFYKDNANFFEAGSPSWK